MRRAGWGAAVALAAAAVPAAGWASCTISSPGINFGGYTGTLEQPGPTPINVTCPSGITYQIGIDAGQHSGGTSYNWNMRNGTDASLLHYQVFRDGARTQYWGNSVNNDTMSGSGTGSSQTLYAYTQLPANTAATPGAYTDTIAMTLYSSDGNGYYGSMSVNGMVQAGCTLSTSPLAFGVYTGAAVAASTSLAVTCTNTTTYTVGLDTGLHPTGAAYGRRMAGPGGSYLTYGVSRNSANTLSWGTTAGTDTAAGTGTGSSQAITVYGTLAGGQYVTPGAYSDTLTFTVSY